MNVAAARNVDYWLGVPLCFLFSGINFVLKAFNFKKKEKKPPQKIALIKLSELGAIILAYPLLKSIKKEYPEADLFFVTFRKNKDVFTLLEDIVSEENVLTIREDSVRGFVLDTLKVTSNLLRKNIDVVFDLEFFSRFTACLAFLTGAGKRVGFYRYTFEGLYRGNLLTHNILYNPLSHISKTYLSLIQSTKKERKNSPELEDSIDNKEIMFPKYTSKNEIKERLRRKLEDFGVNSLSKLFLVNPGEGMLPLREWPIENFMSVSRKLLNGKNSYIALIGTEGVSKKAKVILETINNKRCFSLVAQTDLEELMELFYTADALISNDCGLAHLAMLTPIKKFILFGPESPQIFGPLGENNYVIYSNWPCSPCLSAFNHRNSACKDNFCLKAIKSEEVYALIKESLNIIE